MIKLKFHFCFNSFSIASMSTFAYVRWIFSRYAIVTWGVPFRVHSMTSLYRCFLMLCSFTKMDCVKIWRKRKKRTTIYRFVWPHNESKNAHSYKMRVHIKCEQNWHINNNWMPIKVIISITHTQNQKRAHTHFQPMFVLVAWEPICSPLWTCKSAELMWKSSCSH